MPNKRKFKIIWESGDVRILWSKVENEIPFSVNLPVRRVQVLLRGEDEDGNPVEYWMTVGTFRTEDLVGRGDQYKESLFYLLKELNSETLDAPRAKVLEDKNPEKEELDKDWTHDTDDGLVLTCNSWFDGVYAIERRAKSNQKVLVPVLAVKTGSEDPNDQLIVSLLREIQRLSTILKEP